MNVVRITLFIYCLLAIPAFAQIPRVDKIEPPNWWMNHTVSPVRVVVRGANLRNARVTSKSRDFKFSNLRVNTRGDYLFIDVYISKSAKPGKYAFDLKTPAGSTSIPFEIDTPLDPKTHFRGITNDDIIYLIMTDRFADGDQSNNKDVDRKNPASVARRRLSRDHQ